MNNVLQRPYNMLIKRTIWQMYMFHHRRFQKVGV